jgi:hypothetical protein
MRIGAERGRPRDLPEDRLVRLLRLVRGAAIGVIAVYVIEHIARRTTYNTLNDMYKKFAPAEGIIMRPVYDARSLDLSHLNPDRVSYDHKEIHTEAIQVTPENIGKLSLEFEEELFYDQGGRPYFVFSAKRFDPDAVDGQQPPHELYVRLTDWIVPLWDELHIFRDPIFRNTFTFDNESDSTGHGLHSIPSTDDNFQPSTFEHTFTPDSGEISGPLRS